MAGKWLGSFRLGTLIFGDRVDVIGIVFEFAILKDLTIPLCSNSSTIRPHALYCARVLLDSFRLQAWFQLDVRHLITHILIIVNVMPFCIIGYLRLCCYVDWIGEQQGLPVFQPLAFGASIFDERLTVNILFNFFSLDSLSLS